MKKTPPPEDRIALDFPIAIGKSIIILRGDEEVKTSSGIIIPESTDALRMRGTIMAVGALVSIEFLDETGVVRKLRVGDKIVFNAYANLSIMHKEVSYVMMNELEVYAVLPKGAKVGIDQRPSRKGKKVDWEG